MCTPADKHIHTHAWERTKHTHVKNRQTETYAQLVQYFIDLLLRILCFSLALSLSPTWSPGLCVYVSSSMYVNVYSCVYTYIHTYTCTFRYMYIYTYMNMYMYMYMYVHKYLYMHLYVHTFMYVFACIFIHVHAYL